MITAFAVLVQMQADESVEAPRDAPLRGKRICPSQSESRATKKAKVVYDRRRAEECVMTDWLGDVPRFPDRQFERTFRIKRSMVDIILNNLARHDTFWTSSVCRRGKALYDLDGAVRLKEAMKKHLYRKKFGEEALRTSHYLNEDYNPLSF
jgi:hypothetical protein